MENKIKLSFCIPTYNRAVFLNELIASIVNLCDGRDDIEICISDNCSTDNTEQIINSWKCKTTIPIVYSVNSENIGPDRNYLEAVALANGEYSWLFGSDDALCNFDFDGLLKEIKVNNDPEIILCNRVECDYELNKLDDALQKKWLKSNSNELFDFSERGNISRYFKNCASLGGVFSYLSSIIIKTRKWKSINFDKAFIGTAYSHVFIILSFLSGSRLLYLDKALVLCRGGNDSFSDGGYVKRLMIDYDGYSLLSEYFKSKALFTKQESDDLFEVLREEHQSIKLMLLMAGYSDREEWNRYVNYLARLGFSNKIFLILLRVSKWLIVGSNKIRKLF